MARAGAWVEPHREGLYIPAADAWIDPAVPRPRALVTHGHADHARGGHGHVLATPETLAIMAARYGPQNGQPIAYGETIRLGDVAVRRNDDVKTNRSGIFRQSCERICQIGATAEVRFPRCRRDREIAAEHRARDC
jgi:hypothetical protein